MTAAPSGVRRFLSRAAGRPPRRATRTLCALALVTLSAGALLSITPRRLIAMRAAVFNRHIDLEEFRARAALPPGRWIAQDSPAALTAARDELVRRRPELEAWLASPRAADPDEADGIVARLHSNGMACSPSRELAGKAADLLGGTGTACCSDFVEVFQLLASLRGLATREIANARHNYVEYWDTTRARWSVLDPMFGRSALRPDGTPASALDVTLGTDGDEGTARGADRTPVSWRLVAGRAPMPALASFYASPEAFRRLVVTERSDVAAQDAFDRRLRFLPKPAAQLVELLTGARPRWTELRVEPAAARNQSPHPGVIAP